MQLTQTHQADALSTATLRLKSKSSDVTISLTSPGDIKYLQNQHSFLWLAKSTWIPKEKTDSCEAFKMSYGTRKLGDREDDSAGGLILHLFLPFPVTPASRQGTSFSPFCARHLSGLRRDGQQQWWVLPWQAPGHLVGAQHSVSSGCFGVTLGGQGCKSRLMGRPANRCTVPADQTGPRTLAAV